MRTLAKCIMENWWIRPRNDIPYLKWILQMQEEQIDHIKSWQEAVKTHDEEVRLEKERK